MNHVEGRTDRRGVLLNGRVPKQGIGVGHGTQSGVSLPGGKVGTQHTVIFRAADGGAWQRLADPCGTGQNVHDTAGLAAAPGGFFAVLCVPRTGTGRTFVLTSGDYGSSWSPPRLVPGGTRHHLDLIAAPSARRLVVATGGVTGSGPFTYRLVVSTEGGRRWSAAVTGSTQINPRAPGVAFLGFEDSRVGRWVSDQRDIWTTRDGGLHWHRRPFPLHRQPSPQRLA